MRSTEADLIEEFTSSLIDKSHPWARVQVAREFYYLRGRADVVVVDGRGKVIAIEGKLRRWREALHQAYRNRCFANASYVLLPPQVAENALRFQGEFERRGVGLCCCIEGTIHLLLDAAWEEPLQPWLRDAAQSSASGDPIDIRNPGTGGKGLL